MKRILIIQPWIQLGGAEIASIHLALALMRRGHSAAIACTYVDAHGLPDQARSLDYRLPLRPLAELCRRSRPFFLLFGSWLLLLTVMRAAKGADVLNPHNFPSAWIAVLVGKLRGIPVIWTCNEPPERPRLRELRSIGPANALGWLLASSPLDRFLSSKVDAVYTLSERTRRQIRRRYGRNAEVLRPGIDEDLYRNGRGLDLPAGLDLAGKFVLLTVGKLHPQKNQIAAIGALERLLPDIPNLVLLLAGDGPMRREWEQYVEEHGLGQHTCFLGSVPRAAMPTLYSCCNLNLFTPINQSWGLTPFEALLMGRVSVVSNDSGAAEVIAARSIGLVCEPSAGEVADCIVEVHSGPDRYRAMAERGRDYVATELTWDEHADGFLQMVARIDLKAVRSKLLSVPGGTSLR